MSKKRAELAEGVGKAFLDGAKAAGKEAGKELGGGIDPKMPKAARELNDVLEHVLATQQRITLNIWRISGFGGEEEYISSISNIDPALLREQGVEQMVKSWCGGGHYRIVLRAPGVPDKNTTIKISGDPLPPKPERDKMLQQQQPSNMGGLTTNPVLPGAPTSAVPGQYYAPHNAAGFANYLGLPPPQTPTPVSPAVTNNDMMTTMFTHMMDQIKQMQPDPRKDEIAELRRQLDEERAERRRDEERRELERQRFEAERRHEKDREENNRRFEEVLKQINATPKENPNVAILSALAPILTPVVHEMITKGSKDAEATAKQMENMLAMQQHNSTQSMEMVKMMTAKTPVEERMASMMGNVLGLTGSFVSQMQSIQGEQPAWLQIVNQVLDGVKEVGAVALSGGFATEEMVPEDHPQLPAPALPDGAEAAAEAVKVIKESAKEEEEQDGAMGNVAFRRDQFDTAIQTIFKEIEGQAPPEEVVFRLWKHSDSGAEIATSWLNEPEQVTREILGTLAETGQLDIHEDRIIAIIEAIKIFNLHLAAAGTPEAYRAQHNITIKMPKRKTVEPKPEVVEVTEVITNEGEVVDVGRDQPDNN